MREFVVMVMRAVAGIILASLGALFILLDYAYAGMDPALWDPAIDKAERESAILSKTFFDVGFCVLTYIGIGYIVFGLILLLPRRAAFGLLLLLFRCGGGSTKGKPPAPRDPLES